MTDAEMRTILFSRPDIAELTAEFRSRYGDKAADHCERYMLVAFSLGGIFAYGESLARLGAPVAS